MPKFQPGQSGNPKGRPKKGEAITDVIRKHLKKRITITNPKTGEQTRTSTKDHLVHVLIAKASKGDLAALRYLIDRVDGTPKQTVEHDGEVNTGPGVVVVLPDNGRGDYDQD